MQPPSHTCEQAMQSASSAPPKCKRTPALQIPLPCPASQPCPPHKGCRCLRSSSCRCWRTAAITPRLAQQLLTHHPAHTPRPPARCRSPARTQPPPLQHRLAATLLLLLHIKQDCTRIQPLFLARQRVCTVTLEHSAHNVFAVQCRLSHTTHSPTRTTSTRLPTRPPACTPPRHAQPRQQRQRRPARRRRLCCCAAVPAVRASTAQPPPHLRRAFFMNRTPHALHSVLGPAGPARHTGVDCSSRQEAASAAAHTPVRRAPQASRVAPLARKPNARAPPRRLCACAAAPAARQRPLATHHCAALRAAVVAAWVHCQA